MRKFFSRTIIAATVALVSACGAVPAFAVGEGRNTGDELSQPEFCSALAQLGAHLYIERALNGITQGDHESKLAEIEKQPDADKGKVAKLRSVIKFVHSFPVGPNPQEVGQEIFDRCVKGPNT